MFKHFILRDGMGDGGGGSTQTGQGSGASGEGAGSGSNSPDYKALYTQLQAEHEALKTTADKQYKGLQGTLAKEQEAHKGTKDALTGLTERFGGMETLFGATRTEKETAQTALAEAQKQIAELSSKNARMTLIMDKFPTLAGFEAKGLLPTAAADKLEEVLTAFQNTLSTQVEAGKKSYQSGAAQPPSGPQNPPTASAEIADLRKQVHDAVIKGDNAAYNKAYDALLEAQKKQ